MGLGTEKFKLAVYLIIPMAAVYMYSIPWVHETSIRTNRYIVYQNMHTLKGPRGDDPAVAPAAGRNGGGDREELAEDGVRRKLA